MPIVISYIFTTNSDQCTDYRIHPVPASPSSAPREAIVAKDRGLPPNEPLEAHNVYIA